MMERYTRFPDLETVLDMLDRRALQAVEEAAMALASVDLMSLARELRDADAPPAILDMLGAAIDLQHAGARFRPLRYAAEERARRRTRERQLNILASVAPRARRSAEQ